MDEENLNFLFFVFFFCMMANVLAAPLWILWFDDSSLQVSALKVPVCFSSGPLRMSGLCPLVLVLLVLCGIWVPAVSDVGDFSPCLQFFYRSCPPKGLTGTTICQRYLNQFRFATLYSRQRRSPWFSAYVYSVPAGKRPPANWKFEPQVCVGAGDV